MNKYRVVRTNRSKFYGDGSEGFSRQELIKEIVLNALKGARYIRHDDRGPSGSKRLTKVELFELLKEVAPFVRRERQPEAAGSATPHS
jgi:hypothetical protein